MKYCCQLENEVYSCHWKEDRIQKFLLSLKWKLNLK
jgi:hypothetical protein